jgi:hypothetical protein
MCLSGATCLPAVCCFSELALFPLKCVGLLQSGHHHFIECNSLWYSWKIAYFVCERSNWLIFFNSWWYNVERKEADKQLLLPGNPQGTFLVRESAGKIYQESKYGTQIKTETWRNLKPLLNKHQITEVFSSVTRGCHGRDRMVVGFTTTCAISAYHH